MRVSIITVSYNSHSTIRDTIESVISQDYHEIEYIIIDGGSDDGTLEIIKNYTNRISYLLSEKDSGIYDAMNKGIQIATGAIVGVLNSDDCYAHNQVISRVVDRLNTTGNDALYGDLMYVDNKTKKIVRRWHAGPYRKGIFKYGWMPPHPTFFVKKEIYERYGRYNTDLRSAADYELMLRFIHRYEISLTYLPEILVIMKTGGVSNSSLRNRIRANKEDLKAWKLNNLNPFFLTTCLKPLRKISQYISKL